MKTLFLRLFIALNMLCGILAARSQQYGSVEWAFGQAMNMLQYDTQIYHYLSSDGSGIIIEPLTKSIIYCERDKRSSVPYIETMRNGNKAYVATFGDIVAYQVTQNGQSYLLVSYNSRPDFKKYYFIGKDKKVDSSLKTPCTPLKSVFAAANSQYVNAYNAAQSVSSPSYNGSSGYDGGATSTSTSSTTSSASVTNRMAYQRAYDGYVDQLNAMRYGNYPYQDGFRISDMQNIQNQMRSLRSEWNTAHPDNPINAAPAETWNGSK